MDLKEYRNNINRLYSDFDKSFAPEVMEQLSAQFAFVSASLSNFLPTIHISRHEALYRQILLHQKISVLDETSPWYPMQDMQCDFLENIDMNTIKNHPAVFCTMHTGSYRLINYFLKQYRIPFVLVANKQIVATEKDRFEKHYNAFTVEGGLPLSLIDAEHPTSALMMFRALKQGYSLLLYIDGNTGSGEALAENENVCSVNFLAQNIYARSGAAYLSFKAKVPLIPVVSIKPSTEINRLLFLKKIYPSNLRGEAKSIIHQATQQVYSQIEFFIKQYPGQWEGWLYLHKFANIVKTTKIKNLTPPVTKQVHFNSNEFATFKIDSNFFLLRKNTYTSFPIDGKLYDFLSYCLPSHIKNIALENVLLDELLSERIVIKCSL